ncbi:lipocalin family protein [Lacihabitans sp. LS3-19]|uniref:lipocalin family protein n=1 Tax=Lacihabitans sp. LS3-19 TaxID=2487335 RepID=UPI0020CBB94E|nr:lipocalin family protein [Lacihabitans sp. LS3-19]
MKNHFLILITLIVASLSSCTKSDDVSPSSLSGKYELKIIDFNSKFTSEDPEKYTDDVSSQGIFYIFNTDGTYKTNAYWSIGEINSNGTESTGKYSLKGNVLSITYIDQDLEKELTQSMQIKTNTDTDLVLYMGLAEVKDSFTAAATGLDPFTAAFLNIFIGQMLEFDYTLSFKKIS